LSDQVTPEGHLCQEVAFLFSGVWFAIGQLFGGLPILPRCRQRRAQSLDFCRASYDPVLQAQPDGDLMALAP
jgi:hypothetical protein